MRSTRDLVAEFAASALALVVLAVVATVLLREWDASGPVVAVVTVCLGAVAGVRGALLARSAITERREDERGLRETTVVGTSGEKAAKHEAEEAKAEKDRRKAIEEDVKAFKRGLKRSIPVPKRLRLGNKDKKEEREDDDDESGPPVGAAE